MGRYTTAEAVLRALGADPDDPDNADLLEDAGVTVLQAEDWIDAYIGHAFGDTDSQPGELVEDEISHIDGPMVMTERVPITGVLDIALRSKAVGADEEVLEEFVGYEISDAKHGIIRLDRWSRHWLLRISYTTAHDTIPSVVRRAALLLATNWLLLSSPAAATIHAATSEVGGQMKAVTIEGTLRVDYAVNKSSDLSSVSTKSSLLDANLLDTVKLLLAPYRSKRRFVFA